MQNSELKRRNERRCKTLLKAQESWKKMETAREEIRVNDKQQICRITTVMNNEVVLSFQL